VKGFAYLLDYDRAEQVPALALTLADTQTYGLRATAAAAGQGRETALAASYARQRPWADNAAHFDADYVAGEADLSARGFTVTGGYEKLGSDNGIALQTPMATLHKFNGWADLFLTTPAAGLRDLYAGLAKSFRSRRCPGSTPGLPGTISTAMPATAHWAGMGCQRRLQVAQAGHSRQVCRLQCARVWQRYPQALA
jgi:hypothetical protein